jgi:hypothetical protein
MSTKLNLVGAIVIAAATFAATPFANASTSASLAGIGPAATTTAVASLAVLNAGAGGSVETAAENMQLAGGRHKRWRHRHGHGWRHGWDYGFGYGYGRGCRWLKRKARRTGSRYWWRQYKMCRSGYY